MNWPDIINGAFEAGASITTWMNVAKIRTDKKVRGVYYPVYFFYTAWGFWNLAYYPILGQWFSALAGSVLVIGNVVWLGHAIRYRHNS